MELLLRYWCIHDDDRNLPPRPHHSLRRCADLYEATTHGALMASTQDMSGRD